MRRVIATAVCIIVVSFGVALAARAIVYPPAPHDNTVDTYYGVHVPDPYRPLENLNAPATRAWESQEEAITRRYLAAIPQRSHIFAMLRKDANYEKIGVPFHEKNQYFYSYNSGLQNQDVWYTKDGLGGKPRLLLDPNKLSADGTTSAYPSPSRDGRFVAVLYSQAGFPWTTIGVRNVETGRDLPDRVKWTKFTFVWKPDGSGFYYDHYMAPKGGILASSSISAESIYFHKLGTPQSADVPIYSDPRRTGYIYGLRATEDGRYLVLSVAQGTSINDELYYARIDAVKPTFSPLVGKMDANYSVIDNDGPIFYIETTLNAPNHKIVAVDIRKPGRMRTIVPERTDVLSDVTTAHHRMFLSYMHDVHSLIEEYAYYGRWLRDVALPGAGVASGFSGHRDDRTVYYDFESYTTPPTVYAYDVVTGTSSVYNRPKIDFDPSQFVTKEVFYRSKDGTRVPLFISYHKGLRLDGQNPTILYGYGGFDIPSTPYFSTDVGVWLKMGGIYAVANIRGGSEYGEAWHRGGMVLTKQNVFDDFIAAAEYLIAHGYSSRAKIAASGASNGGLLVGAVETERPDLWGAVLPEVGVLDMLRYHLWTDGKWWIPDYGCSTCSEAQFRALYAYSPYHNIRPGTHYPPTMVMTSDHDVHVYAAHSLKFVARLQQAQSGDAPILLRIETNAGHGASNLTKQLQETADQYAFLVKNLDMTLPSSF